MPSVDSFQDLPEFRLDQITDEVFDLLELEDDFGFFEEPGEKVNLHLEKRLQEILTCPEIYQTIELAMYVRASSRWRKNLPSWDSLLQVSVELGKKRGEPVHEIFFGTIQDSYSSNTPES